MGCGFDLAAAAADSGLGLVTGLAILGPDCCWPLVGGLVGGLAELAASLDLGGADRHGLGRDFEREAAVSEVTDELEEDVPEIEYDGSEIAVYYFKSQFKKKQGLLPAAAAVLEIADLACLEADAP